MEDNLLEGLDNATRKEVEELLQVTRERDGSKKYALAQIDIFKFIFNSDGLELGIEYLKNVEESDDEDSYYIAMSLIAVSRSRLKIHVVENCELMIKVLKKGNWVSRISLEFAFEIARDCFLMRNYGKSMELFSLIDGSYSYQSSCYEKICKLKMHSETEKIGELGNDLRGKVEEIIDILKLDFLPLSEEEQAPERKLAHYTGTYTTNKLLSIEEKKDRPSAFRLNTINNVNDPSEGQLLSNHLKGVKETSFYTPDFDDKLHAFISCFTFNHDSLNQFRLYGKQDNKEASGVSLVFNKEFFEAYTTQTSIPNIYINKELNKVVNDSDKEKDNKEIERVKEQPVMRCVYIDPTSDYIHLAQRNRLTFFREFGDVILKGGSTTKAEAEWNEYKKYIEKKTDRFKKAFAELKTIYGDAIEEKDGLKGISREDVDEIDSLLEMIILPLKYLIKHSAFQEEQECRMVYITSLDDPKVQMDFGKFLYVEYEPEVKAHLDKIYIAPAASHYEPYFAKLLCGRNNMGKKIKIEPSNNPYRQTS